MRRLSRCRINFSAKGRVHILSLAAVAPAQAELQSFLRERGLAAYKIPDRVEMVEDFPQTGVGKVSKKEARAAIAEKMSAA